MTEWTFRLTLRGIELTDEQLDTLHEAAATTRRPQLTLDQEGHTRPCGRSAPSGSTSERS